MQIEIIVAMTKEGVIGKAGGIPWRISDEMKLFRKLTVNNTVIMGRATWLSLPEKFRPLPDRINIVVSSTMTVQDGAVVCAGLEDAVEAAKKYPGRIFCIGGAQLYRAALAVANVLHISWVKKDYVGDVYFPKVDFAKWKEVETEEFGEFTYKKYINITANR